MLGVAAAHGTHRIIFIAGAAGLVAGAMSMATVGNANVPRGVVRVMFWSAVAMGETAGIGALLETVRVA